MTDSKIPKAIRQIIDVYIYLNFRPFTYKLLSDRLNIEPNTLVQRINRYGDYFQIEGDRPKIIKLNKDFDIICFYRDKNICQICQKKKEPDELLVRLKDKYLKNKEKWDNMITCCRDCKDINLIKRLSHKTKPFNINSGNQIWEYMEVEIREIYKEKNPHMELYFPDLKKYEKEYEYYCEVDELNGQGWYHIIDDNNEIIKHRADVLNYYGTQGWELVIVRQTPPEYEDDEWGNDIYVFKRKKVIEES